MKERDPCACGPPAFEAIFISILAGLFAEGRVPNGSVLDSGAKDGGFSCYFASQARTRKFHAIEPLRHNAASISRRFGQCKRIDSVQCGLGEHRRRLDPGAEAAKLEQLTSGPHVPQAGATESDEAFTVATIDELLNMTRDALASPCSRGWSPDETLGLVHLDVEGAELPAVVGGRRALKRDMPLLTLEVHVHQNASYTRSLLLEVAGLGYDCYLVEEICGLRADCRNLICIPHARQQNFMGSPILDLATASRKIFQVDADAMAAHAYPCCASGGACCLRGPRHRHCCTKETVAAWLRSTRRDANDSAVLTGLQRDPALFAPTIFFHQARYRFPGPAPGPGMYNTLQ